MTEQDEQEEWDRQIEADSDSGSLDFLIQQAAEAKKRGELADL